MKIAEMANILKSIGWSTRKDEVGDRVAEYVLSDRTVDIIYGLDRIRNEQKLEAMLSLTTESFSKTCSLISARGERYAPLICSWNNILIYAHEILEEHVQEASAEAIAWAQDQDLDKALQNHAALPTDAPGARPVWHLAALAILGDVARLKSYQTSFEAGDRLGFVNYVTKDYIDRAVALAEQCGCRS